MALAVLRGFFLHFFKKKKPFHVLKGSSYVQLTAIFDKLPPRAPCLEHEAASMSCPLRLYHAANRTSNSFAFLRWWELCRETLKLWFLRGHTFCNDGESVTQLSHHSLLKGDGINEDEKAEGPPSFFFVCLKIRLPFSSLPLLSNKKKLSRAILFTQQIFY